MYTSQGFTLQLIDTVAPEIWNAGCFPVVGSVGGSANMRSEIKPIERRTKTRFPIRRELRYKLLENDTIVAVGSGETLDLSSCGVGLAVDQQLTPGAFVEISISWPVLLDQTCPMRLIVFGRVVRSEIGKAGCTVDKYEFRTQARRLQLATPVRSDSMLQRWADGIRREGMKAGAAVSA